MPKFDRKTRLTNSGTLSNTLRHQDGCAYHFEPHRIITKAPIIELSDVHDLQTTLSSVSAERLLSFSFPLLRKSLSPIYQSTLATKSGEILPSSLNVLGYWCSSSPSRYSCSAQTTVRYELHAIAYKDDEKVSTTYSEVKIYDTDTPLPPPIHLAHFPGEYTVSQSRPLRKLGMRGGSLSVTVSEPSPLEIRSGDGIALTALPVRLRLEGEGNKWAKSARLNVRLTSRLRMHSYFSAGAMEAHPTDAQTKGSPFLGSLNKYGRKFVKNLRVDEWKVENGALVKDMVVLVPVLENDKPSPTFFTAYLARRYSLAINMEVNAGWYKAAYRLNVPVQIVYPEEPIGYEGMHSDSWEAEERAEIGGMLPVYTR
jgi:hypothetical protein